MAANISQQAAQGSEFTCGLVAYVESRRESALSKLDILGKNSTKIADISPAYPSKWEIGAPVSVRLSGKYITTTPQNVDFEWNGFENLAPFSVHVDESAPDINITLYFTVTLAGFTMAQLPMTLEISRIHTKTGGSTHDHKLIKRAPQTAFASYSSKDAKEVSARLSTLIRWSPDLDIFQDCLDLTPNKSYKKQLRDEIISRDSFILFWSRAASQSQWVKWEYKIARNHKDISAIIPIPLEDPAIANPPADFKAIHWRDKFMIAKYALEQIKNQTIETKSTSHK